MFLMVDKFDFGYWIQEQREIKGWSQADLSRHSGLHRAVISKLESGTRPMPETLTALAIAFKMSPADIFRKAGLLPPNRANDEAEERASYLLRTLKTSASKKRAIDYLELLIQQEERDGYDDAQTTATQPR